jgi:hypothetical protein
MPWRLTSAPPTNNIRSPIPFVYSSSFVSRREGAPISRFGALLVTFRQTDLSERSLSSTISEGALNMIDKNNAPSATPNFMASRLAARSIVWQRCHARAHLLV